MEVLGVDLHFKDLCMKYSWDGDHIFSLLLGMWGCAFKVYKTKNNWLRFECLPSFVAILIG
jgi:hypothetical protein